MDRVIFFISHLIRIFQSIVFFMVDAHPRIYIYTLKKEKEKIKTGNITFTLLSKGCKNAPLTTIYKNQTQRRFHGFFWFDKKTSIRQMTEETYEEKEETERLVHHLYLLLPIYQHYHLHLCSSKYEVSDRNTTSSQGIVKPMS